MARHRSKVGGYAEEALEAVVEDNICFYSPVEGSATDYRCLAVPREHRLCRDAVAGNRWIELMHAIAKGNCVGTVRHGATTAGRSANLELNPCSALCRPRLHRAIDLRNASSGNWTAGRVKVKYDRNTRVSFNPACGRAKEREARLVDR